jgi:hypothetical protein
LTVLAAETVPLWAALVASLGSGLVGAAVTARLNAQAARDERWRDRLITAAEGFQQELMKASAAYQGVVNRVKHRRDLDQLQEHWSEAVEVTNSARQKHAAVFLVFGGHSPVNKAAVAALNAIDQLEAEMQNVGPGALERIEEKMREMVGRTLLLLMKQVGQSGRGHVSPPGERTKLPSSASGSFQTPTLAVM